LNHLLYHIGIFFYGLFLRIAALFHPKAKAWVTGRQNLFASLPQIEKKVYWFHCASLGEFDQALPLINRIKNDEPDTFLLVTFFSPSGMEHYHKREHSSDYVCYIPLDTKRNAQKFIQHFKPNKVFFIKYEFWANHLFAAKKSGASLYCVSGIFRPNQRFFKKNNHFFASILHAFDAFYVQNEASQKLLQQLSIQKVYVTGDTRYDRVIENKNKAKDNPIIANFTQEKKAFIIGSSWPEDEENLVLLIDSIVEKPILIAPHDISEKHLKQIESRLNCKSIRYTEINDSTDLLSNKILIIDTIGHLSSAYKYGDIAYVGGGYSGNLHNILEPAVFGLPVIFGPKHSRFPEATSFIEENIGISAKNAEEVKAAYIYFTENLEKIQVKTTHFVHANQGASEKIWISIKQLETREL
jgi:3-deoxy-D-manno-octulosonic-acid transferase